MVVIGRDPKQSRAVPHIRKVATKIPKNAVMFFTPLCLTHPPQDHNRHRSTKIVSGSHTMYNTSGIHITPIHRLPFGTS